MSKFLSGRLRRLLVGITGYTENQTVVQTTGKVGIGTTDAQQHSLFVVGSTNITGDTIVGGGLTAVGIGSFQDNVYIDQQLYVGGVNVTGGANIGEDITTRNLKVTGISTVVGISTVESTLFANELSVAGVSTFNTRVEIDNVRIDGNTVDTTSGNLILDSNIGLVEINDDLQVDGDSDLNGDLDVDGHTELDNTRVVGVLTVSGRANIDSVRIDGNTVDTTSGNLILDSNTGLVDINDAVDILGDVDIEDTTESTSSTTGALKVAGGAGIAKNLNVGKDLNVNENLDVDGHAELDQLRVSGVSTFAGDATFQSDVFLGDNDRLRLGDSQDLQIYHTGSLSYISENGPGSLRLTGNQIRIRNGADSEELATFTQNSSVDLFYNGSKKFETTGIGVSISNGGTDTATIAGPENLIIDPAAVGDNTGIVRIKGDLYVDGTEFKVDSSTINLADLKVGIATNVSTSLLLDGGGIGIGDPDVAGLEKTLLWNHTNNRMEFNANLYAPNFATGNINLENLYVSGLSTFVGVTTNQSTLFANQLSVSGVSTFQGNVHLGDDDRLRLGDGNDLQIYHNSANNHSIISENGGGDLRISADRLVFLNPAATETTAVFDPDGSVELYYDNSKKFETTGYGVTIYNDLRVGTGVTIYGNTGIVSAISFYGDGSNLTNTGATLGATSGVERLVTTQLTSGTMVDAATDADLTYNATDDLLSTPNLAVSGGISTDGYDTGNQFELMRADGNGGWEWAAVPGIFSVNNILNGFNVREEGLTVGTAGSIHTLDFRGINVTASADPQPNGIATVTFSTTPTFTDITVTGNTTIPNVIGVTTFSNNVNVGSAISMYAATGIISATAFYGDGSNLANTGATLNAAAGTQRLVLTSLTSGTMVDAATDGDLTFTAETNELAVPNLNVGTSATISRLNVTGVSTFSDDVEILGSNKELYVQGQIRADNIFSNGGDLVVRGGGNTAARPGFIIPNSSSSNFQILGNSAGTGDISIDSRGTGEVIISASGNQKFTTTNGGIDITGHVETDTLRVSGLSTFQGRIVGAATSNVIPFLYANYSDLPSAGTYHGAFAHVHATGKAYYAHAGNWLEIVSKDVNGIIGTGTETYNVGNINITGITTLGGPVTAGSSEGVAGQYLRHVGTGVTWANFPTLRTTQTFTALAGQTTFNFTYNVDFLDVYVNGVKLSPSEYTATNGSDVVLDVAAFAGDTVELYSYNTASTYGGGGGSSYTDANVNTHLNVSTASAGEILSWNGSDYAWVADQTGGSGGSTVWEVDSVGINTTKSVGIGTTAKSGYSLYVEGDARVTGILTVGPASVTIDGINNEVTVGTGITLYGNTGIISATSLNVTGALSGDGSSLTGLTGASANTYGNGTVVPQIVVDANGRITSISNVAISGGGGGGGTSIIVKDSQSLVGAAGTIDFGTGLSVSPVSAGIVTVTASSSGISLTDLSVTTNSVGTAALSYNNTNGVFTYTPPDLSSYLTSYTETDPVVAAISGIVKSDGSTISAATAGTDYIAPGSEFTSQWTFTASDSNNYQVTGPGFAANSTDPTIYVMRGHRYKFTNNASSHPLQIQYEFQNASGTAYTDGITNSNDVITWEVRNDTPDLLHYQCTSHGNMSGRIVVLGDVVTNGSWTASAGVAQTLDTISGIANNAIKTAEYTVHIENGSNMQAQKVLVMQDGTTAYSQEYAIMHKSGLLVSMSATISGGNLLLQATPETGVSGTTTYKITRQTMR